MFARQGVQVDPSHPGGAVHNHPAPLPANKDREGFFTHYIYGDLLLVYIVGEIRTGSPNDETPWLPNKEMTKLSEVSDETSTNLFLIFSVRHSSVTLRLSNLGSRGWDGSWGLTSEVSLWGSGSGSEGGVFSRKRHWFSWTFFRLDPTRPDLDLGAQFSYRIPRPDPLRPDPILTPYWRVATRRVGRFSYRMTRCVGRFSKMALISHKVTLARARSAGACTPQPHFLAFPE
jgi:hypothetical protein